MNIFNVPQEFWEEHTLLCVTLSVSLTLNLFFLGLLLANWATDRLERKAKERKEMIEQIVKRVKYEIEIEQNDQKKK